jgi:GntR family transcriptional regulator
MLSDKIPLNFQIFRLLRERIDRGDFGPSGRLPTEIELAKTYGVSVITVQRALKDLSSAGLITRHRRRGTFVKIGRAAVRPRQSDALSLMFSDEFGTDTEVFGKTIVPRPDRLRSVFSHSEKLLHIRRVVMRGDVPWSYASIYVIPVLADRITRPMVKRYPMFRLLREKLGLQFKNVTINLQSRPAPMDIAQILQVDSLAPVMVMEATLFDKSDCAVNWLEIYYRGDEFVFRFDMNLEKDARVKKITR